MKLLLITLIALTPLPFGSVDTVWQWFWVLFIGLMGVVTTWHISPRQESARHATGEQRTIDMPTLLVLAVVLWGTFQAKLFSSNVSLVVLQSLASPTEITAAALENGSLNEYQTLKTTLSVLSHLVLFWIVSKIPFPRKFVIRVPSIIVVVISTYAVYGLVEYFSGNESVLWFKKYAYKNSLTSSFVNANNFAAYLGLGLLTSVVAAGRHIFIGHKNYYGRKEMFMRFLDIGWLYVLAAFLILTALLLTGSRAGLLTVLTGAVVAIWATCYATYARFLKKRYVIGLCILVLAVTISLGGELLQSRFKKDIELDQRWEIYSITVELIKERPLTGYGLGTFETIFGTVRSNSVESHFVRGHSDLLEFALTAGIPAMLAMLTALFLLAAQITKRLYRRGRNDVFTLVFPAIFVQLGLHALIDFPFQIPAISYLFVIFLAFASRPCVFRADPATGSDLIRPGIRNCSRGWLSAP